MRWLFFFSPSTFSSGDSSHMAGSFCFLLLLLLMYVSHHAREATSMVGLKCQDVPKLQVLAIRRNCYCPDSLTLLQAREDKQSSETRLLEGFCFQCNWSNVEVPVKLS